MSVVRRIHVLLLSLPLTLLMGCWAKSKDSAPAAPADTPEQRAKSVHGGEPQTEEEKMIAAYLLKEQLGQSDQTVEWLRWGPHDLKGETVLKHPDTTQFRARYRVSPRSGMPTTWDRLYAIVPTEEWVAADPEKEKRTGSMGPSKRVRTGKRHVISGANNQWGDNWIEEALREKKAMLDLYKPILEEKAAPP